MVPGSYISPLREVVHPREHFLFNTRRRVSGGGWDTRAAKCSFVFWYVSSVAPLGWEWRTCLRSLVVGNLSANATFKRSQLFLVSASSSFSYHSFAVPTMQNRASPAFQRSSDSLARRWANCQMSRTNVLHSSASRPENVNGGFGGVDGAVCGGGGTGWLLNIESDETGGGNRDGGPGFSSLVSIY